MGILGKNEKVVFLIFFSLFP